MHVDANSIRDCEGLDFCGLGITFVTTIMIDTHGETVYASGGSSGLRDVGNSPPSPVSRGDSIRLVEFDAL